MNYIKVSDLHELVWKCMKSNILISYEIPNIPIHNPIQEVLDAIDEKIIEANRLQFLGYSNAILGLKRLKENILQINP